MMTSYSVRMTTILILCIVRVPIIEQLSRIRPIASFSLFLDISLIPIINTSFRLRIRFI